MPKGINGLAIGISLGGAAFLYSGISGAGLSDTIRGFISGQLPTPQGFNVTDGSGTVAGGASGGSVASLAQQQIGKPYVWDTPKSWHTKNPPTFDCSGLYGWCVFQVTGKTLPHSAAAMRLMLKKRPLSSAQPGDAVFYAKGADTYHVAVYAGNMTVIEAPEKGVPVRTRTIHAGDADLVAQVGICPGGGTTAAAAVTGKGGTPAQNKALAQSMAAAYGWTGSEWTALDELWTRESGFNNTAKNPSSGAYGIAQALPQTKYPAKGQESGGSDAGTQIRWGLRYIKQRYGSPSAAWAHETANSWY